MSLTKLNSTDAFVVIDLDGAPTAAGVVRCARKILQGGARDLARHLTYAYAGLGLEVSGASAGINAEGDARDGAVAAFAEELGPRADEGALVLTAGKGVRPEEVAGLGPPLPTNIEELWAAGVVAAAGAARGTLDGASIALEDVGHGADELRRAVEAAGGRVVAQGPDAWTAESDVLGVGSKAGVVDHEGVGAFSGRILVPIAPLAITTRALATGARAGVTILPDFVTTAGSLVRGETTPEAVGERIGGIIAEVRDHPDGPVLGACERAEAFLAGWRDELPFGRPI